MTKNRQLIAGITLFLMSLALFLTGILLLLNTPQTSDVSVADLSQQLGSNPMNFSLGNAVVFGNITTASFNFVAPKVPVNSLLGLCYVDAMFGTGGGSSQTRHPITVLSGSVSTPSATVPHTEIINTIRGGSNQSVIVDFRTGPAVKTGERVSGSFTYKAGPGTVWSETPTVKVECVIVSPEGNGYTSTGFGRSAFLPVSWLNPNPAPPAVAPQPVTPPPAVSPQPTVTSQPSTSTSSAQTPPPAVSEEDPRAVSDFGEIVFSSAIDLTTADLKNLTNQIAIGKCAVGIDESLSGLRQASGKITLKGVKLANERAVIWKDGDTNFTNEVTNVIYNATTETLSFEVADITTYQLGSGLELVDISNVGEKLVVKGKVNDLTSIITVENSAEETIADKVEVSLNGGFVVEIDENEEKPVVVAQSCSGRKDKRQVSAEFSANNTAIILIVIGLAGMVAGSGVIIYDRMKKSRTIAPVQPL